MTYVKKVIDSWAPQEFPDIKIGDVVDFPGPVEQLVKEGTVALCDKDGNPVSAFDTFGIMSDNEIEEFKAWRKLQGQEALKKSLEKEKDKLLAEAETLKKQIDTPVKKEKTEEEKKAWGIKMAEARAKKKANQTRDLPVTKVEVETEGAKNA